MNERCLLLPATITVVTSPSHSQPTAPHWVLTSDRLLGSKPDWKMRIGADRSAVGCARAPAGPYPLFIERERRWVSQVNNNAFSANVKLRKYMYHHQCGMHAKDLDEMFRIADPPGTTPG